MEYPCKSTNSSSSSKLRHRFARLLLGSSCTTTIAASTVVGQNKPPPTTPTHPADDLELDFDSHNRPKLDLRSPFSSVAATNSRLRRVVPLVHVSIDCGSRRSVEVSEREALLPMIPTAAAPPQEQRKFYGATKPRKKKGSCEMKKKKTARIAEAKKPLSSNAYGFTSSSSFDSEKNELGLFSSDDEDEDEEEEEEEERAALFSSKSFSSDSSEFYHRSRRNKNKPTQRSKSMKSTRRPPPPPPRRRHVQEHSCGAIDQLRPLVSISNPRPPGPNKEKQPPPPTQPTAGVAVVKRSSDPYGDFRSSMVDMIVGRGLSCGRDLERLLHSYLALNSPCHHPVILEAFGDIWESIFSKSTA